MAVALDGLQVHLFRIWRPCQPPRLALQLAHVELDDGKRVRDADVSGLRRWRCDESKRECERKHGCPPFIKRRVDAMPFGPRQTSARAATQADIPQWRPTYFPEPAQPA